MMKGLVISGQKTEMIVPSEAYSDKFAKHSKVKVAHKHTKSDTSVRMRKCPEHHLAAGRLGLVSTVAI